MKIQKLRECVLCSILFVTGIAYSQQLAFPTAEGGGKYTVGGRGGIVNEVTNLNDNGPGSFREAVRGEEKKTVVFRVSGTITLDSGVDIGSYTTVAGQTAPGDGITIRKYPIFLIGDHIILRYMRVRLGDETPNKVDAITGREFRPLANGFSYFGKKMDGPEQNGWVDVVGVPVREEHTNLIIDHMSTSWSQDECLSVYHCVDVTIQWCTLTESLDNAGHGFGAIWGGRNNSYHHNLIVSHQNRNPRFCGGTENCDYRNNVIFNWGYASMHGGEDKQNNSNRWNGSYINLVGNYYKPGPGTEAKIRNTIGQLSGGSWYITGNYMHGNPSITADNSKGVSGGKRLSQPVEHTPLSHTQTAEEAFKSVLAYVGCSIKRDPVDERIMKEVESGKTTYGNGLIKSQNDVGGWPELKSTEPPADTDHDGMPDSWETSVGLNPNDPEDRNNTGADGYTMLELYLNSIPAQDKAAIAPLLRKLSTPNGLKLSHPKNNIINFSFPRKSNVKLELFDFTGKRVAILVNEIKVAGSYSIDYSSLNLSIGPFVCKLTSDNTTYSKKMFVVQ